MCSSDLINQLSSHFPVFVYRLAAQMRDSRTRDNKRKHCVKAWTEVIFRVNLTLKMTSAQVVETSVNVISNSPSQDYTHPDDRTLPYDLSSCSPITSIPVALSQCLHQHFIYALVVIIYRVLVQRFGCSN